MDDDCQHGDEFQLVLDTGEEKLCVICDDITVESTDCSECNFEKCKCE